MERIVIDTQQLRGTYSGIREDLERMRSEAARLFEEVDSLSAMWSGSAHDAFVQTFAQDGEWLQQQIDLLAAHADELQNAQESYDRCDEVVRGLIGGIQI